jgi:hypothetical protein
MIRLSSPSESGEPAITVDLMFGSSGIESEIVAHAEWLEAFPGGVVPIATRGHLIALKVLAGRDRDIADARALITVASQTDLQVARRALELIARRGCDRGKDLLVDLAKLVDTSSTGDL